MAFGYKLKSKCEDDVLAFQVFLSNSRFELLSNNCNNSSLLMVSSTHSASSWKKSSCIFPGFHIIIINKAPATGI